MIGKSILGIVAALAMAIGLPFGASAAGFPEKDVTFIIPYSPGGGMDTTARAIARVMGKHLPNDVNVVPKNVPGAGGNKGYNELLRSAPDGYTICVVNFPGAAIPQLVGKEGAIDTSKFAWVGQMSTSAYVLAVSGKTDTFKSLDDIKNLGRAAKMTHTGFGSTSYAAAGVIKDVVGFEAIPLTGYKSSKDYILGMIRGDGDATVAPVQTFYKFVKSGDVRVLMTFEAKSTIDGVPTARELGYPDLEGLGVYRLVAAPPGTPKAVLQVLSDAMQKAMQDPETQAWAKKTKRPFSPLTADETQAAVDGIVGLYQKYEKSIGNRG
jgi:tripartite-type tricarboxylate transporter receptor subunit TctC